MADHAIAVRPLSPGLTDAEAAQIAAVAAAAATGMGEPLNKGVLARRSHGGVGASRQQSFAQRAGLLKDSDSDKTQSFSAGRRISITAVGDRGLTEVQLLQMEGRMATLGASRLLLRGREGLFRHCRPRRVAKQRWPSLSSSDSRPGTVGSRPTTTASAASRPGTGTGLAPASGGGGAGAGAGAGAGGASTLGSLRKDWEDQRNVTRRRSIVAHEDDDDAAAGDMPAAAVAAAAEAAAAISFGAGKGATPYLAQLHAVAQDKRLEHAMELELQSFLPFYEVAENADVYSSDVLLARRFVVAAAVQPPGGDAAAAAAAAGHCAHSVAAHETLAKAAALGQSEAHETPTMRELRGCIEAFWTMRGLRPTP